MMGLLYGGLKMNNFTQGVYEKNKGKIMSFLVGELEKSTYDFVCLDSSKILNVIFNGDKEALTFISSDLFNPKIISFRFNYASLLERYIAMYEFGKVFNVDGYEALMSRNPIDLIKSKNKAKEFINSIDFSLFIDLIVKDLPKYGLYFDSKPMPTIRKKKKFLWFF